MTREEVPPPPKIKAGAKGGKGKVPLSLGGLPLVIYPEIPEGEGDGEHQQFVQQYKTRLLEGEEARRTIGEYFADDAPSGEKGSASRKDLELFVQGRVGEKVVPLLTKLAQGILSSLYDIPLRNLARNRTDNEVSLTSANRLATLRVSFLILSLTLSSLFILVNFSSTLR